MAAHPGAVQHQSTSPSRSYRTYVLLLLLVVNIFNSVDRQILGILGEPIKRDLALADWQLGALTGLAFALLYTFLGIPIARLADRHHRGIIIGICLAIWSIFTGLSALAQSFLVLVIMRIGVGIGEAGCNPAAHSLISDYVRREKRPLALSIYTMGLPLGILLGLGLGGVIAQSFGWRTTMVVAGAPGIVLAVLVLLTLRDRRTVAPSAAQGGTLSGVVACLRALRAIPTYWYIAFGMTVIAFVQASLQTFAGPMFLRYHNVGLETLAAQASGYLGYTLKPIGFLGLALGVTSGLAGAIGMIGGGVIADLCGRRSKDGYLIPTAIAGLAAGPVVVAACMTHDTGLALCLWGLAMLLLMLPTGPAFGVIQMVAPSASRATSVAILMFVMNLFGAGMGPLVTGAISDLYGAATGDQQHLRYALSGVALLTIIASWLFSRTRRHVAADCDRAS